MSNAQHQSNDSTVCGQYCIFFILLRSHGFKYEDVMSAFIKNRVINDKFVCKFVNKYFRLRTTIKNEKFIISSLPTVPELITGNKNEKNIPSAQITSHLRTKRLPR